MSKEAVKTEQEHEMSSSISLKKIIFGSVNQNIRQYTMAIALVSIWVVFTLLTKGTFITGRNLSNLFLQSATIAILAIGMVLVLVAGHLDLSAGSVLGLTGAVAGVLQVNYKMGTVPAILITLALGLLIGLWNGYWVAYRGVPAFIVTLAGMLIFRGAVIGVTGGATIGPMNSSFKIIGQGYIPKIFPDLSFNDTSVLIAIVVIGIYIFFELRQRKAKMQYGFEVLPLKAQVLKIMGISVIVALFFSIMVFYLGIPYSILLVMGLAVLFSYITHKTTFGRYIYAIGGNAEAAKLSGINIKRTVLKIFLIMGTLEAVAGIVFSSRLNAATAAAGNMAELDAIAAAIIGGTSTMGGEGTIVGAIIGALVMASLDNGMSLMNLDITYQYVIKGLILLIAVWVDISTRKKAA